jgi:hypothetical protein
VECESALPISTEPKYRTLLNFPAGMIVAHQALLACERNCVGSGVLATVTVLWISASGVGNANQKLVTPALHALVALCRIVKSLTLEQRDVDWGRSEGVA